MNFYCNAPARGGAEMTVTLKSETAYFHFWLDDFQPQDQQHVVNFVIEPRSGQNWLEGTHGGDARRATVTWRARRLLPTHIASSCCFLLAVADRDDSQSL